MTPCIEHTQGKGKPGVYGFVANEGKTRLMHRHVYRTTHGLSWDGIAGKVVRHKCDNPRCINPDHLEIGTHADNVRDMIERGRAPVWKGRPWLKGEDSPQAKLTRMQADAIRESSKPQRAIAKEFGISQSQVQRIRAGENWL